MARNRDIKLGRSKLPEPLANALRLFGYNWRCKRSRNGKLWTIYPYGKPEAAKNKKTWTLHSDADPELVAKWLSIRERGEVPPTHWIEEPRPISFQEVRDANTSALG